jgi:hypothetical protein
MVMRLSNVAKDSSAKVANLNASYPFPQMPKFRARLKDWTAIHVPKRGRIAFLVPSITLKDIGVFESQEKVIGLEIFCSN